MGTKEDEVKVTPEMIEAGLKTFREWEESVSFNDGYSAFEADAEALVRSILVGAHVQVMEVKEG